MPAGRTGTSRPCAKPSLGATLCNEKNKLASVLCGLRQAQAEEDFVCTTAGGSKNLLMLSLSKHASRLSRDLPLREELLRQMRAPLEEFCAEARALRDEVHGPIVSYSRKVFIPLTHLCRDVCAYCSFAKPPRRGERCYLR